MGDYREPIPVLPELPNTKEARALRKNMMPLVRKVIKAIVVKRPMSEEMMAEMYSAGIWHGSEIVRQKDLPAPPAPRARDVIDVKRTRRRSTATEGK